MIFHAGNDEKMVFFLTRTLDCVVVLIVLLCTTHSKIISYSRQQATFFSTGMDTTICRTIPGLSKSQVELCYDQPDAILAAVQGMDQAVQECQLQLQGYRWNCSALATKGQNPYVSAMLQRGYKETAFARALTAAGVTISIAKGCSSGMITNCGCDTKVYKIRVPQSEMNSKTEWKWGGCSHNLKYGMKFSKAFLDSKEQGVDIQSKINLHNNQVGRRVIANNMQLKCKCHGMSGSCEMKTCWRAVPDFKIVGRILKERFRMAVLVDQTNLRKKDRKFNVVTHKRKRSNTRNKQWLPRKSKSKRDLTTELLFYQKSPNFCEKDPSLDILGTSGRFCNTTSGFGHDSCSNLCCGRGYNLIKNKRVERCNCKFVWCCTVECETCNYEEWISVCK